MTITGYASTDHKSCDFTGVALHVEGAIRAMGARVGARVCKNFS